MSHITYGENEWNTPSFLIHRIHSIGYIIKDFDNVSWMSIQNVHTMAFERLSWVTTSALLMEQRVSRQIQKEEKKRKTHRVWSHRGFLTGAEIDGKEQKRHSMGTYFLDD